MTAVQATRGMSTEPVRPNHSLKRSANVSGQIMRLAPYLFTFAVLGLASPLARCGDSASIRGQSARYSVSFQDPMAVRDSVIESMA
jgi:hypothetical protein